MARPGGTYRSARRREAKKLGLDWRVGRETNTSPGGAWRYGWHASMPQRNGVPPPPKKEPAHG